MKAKEKRLKINTVFGIVVGLVGIVCGLWLLISLDKISGAEFVALSFGFAVIGLIIAFAAEVQEFSIAGNGVKLKELRSEAEKTIEELKQARTELFRFMILQVIQGSQQTLHTVDPRIKNFLDVYKQVKNFGIVDELRNEIEKVLHILLIDQYGKLRSIHQCTKTINDNFDNLNSPSELNILLNDEIIEKFVSFHGQYKEHYDAKKALIEGIESYAKLYVIKIKLDKLETDHAQTDLLRPRNPS